MGPTLLLWREGESQDKDNGWKGPQQESQHQLRASSCLPTPIWALTPDPTPIASGKKAPVLPQKAVLFPGMIKAGKS